MANELLGYQVPGARNVFLPGYSKQRQAEFIQAYQLNEEKFRLNRVITLTNVDTLEGVYPKIYGPDRIRVEDPTGKDVVWPDGRPINLYQHDTNITKARRTNIRWGMQRYLRKDTLGYLLIEQSPYDEVRLRQDELAMKSQLFRTLKTIAVMLTSSNWGGALAAGGRYDTATNLDVLALAMAGYGVAATKWTTGTSANPVMARNIGYMLTRVFLSTLGAVSLEDLVLVMNPTTALALSLSQEIREFIRGFPGALEFIRGTAAGGQWFLPQPLFGVRVEILDTPKITGNPTHNADTPVFAWPDGVVGLFARPGAITSGIGGSPFSSVHIFQLRDHAFRPMQEDLGRIHQAVYVAVEDAFQPIIVAPESGFVVTGVI